MTSTATPPAAPTIQRITLALDGLDRSGVVAQALAQALSAVAGVRYAYVNMATEMAYVIFDAHVVGQEQLVATIVQNGAQAGPPELR